MQVQVQVQVQVSALRTNSLVILVSTTVRFAVCTVSRIMNV